MGKAFGHESSAKKVKYPLILLNVSDDMPYVLRIGRWKMTLIRKYCRRRMRIKNSHYDKKTVRRRISGESAEIPTCFSFAEKHLTATRKLDGKFRELRWLIIPIIRHKIYFYLNIFSGSKEKQKYCFEHGLVRAFSGLRLVTAREVFLAPLTTFSHEKNVPQSVEKKGEKWKIFSFLKNERKTFSCLQSFSFTFLRFFSKGLTGYKDLANRCQARFVTECRT